MNLLSLLQPMNPSVRILYRSSHQNILVQVLSRMARPETTETIDTVNNVQTTDKNNELGPYHIYCCGNGCKVCVLEQASEIEKEREGNNNKYYH